MDFVLQAGFSGIAIIAVTLFLTLFGILFIAVTRSKRVTILFAVVSFLPLLIGLSGTYMGERMIDEQMRIETAVSSPDEQPHPEDVEVIGRQEAKSPTYLGLAATTLLLAISGCGMVFARKPAA